MTIHEIIEQYEFLTIRIRHQGTRAKFRVVLDALKSYVAEQEKKNAPTPQKPVRVRSEAKRGRPSAADPRDLEKRKTRRVRSVPKAAPRPTRVLDTRKRDVGGKAPEVQG